MSVVEDDMAEACKKTRADIKDKLDSPPCRGKLEMTDQYRQSGSDETIKASASRGCRTGCKCLDPKSDITRETQNGQEVEYIVSICQEKNTGTDPTAHSFGVQINRE